MMKRVIFIILLIMFLFQAGNYALNTWIKYQGIAEANTTLEVLAMELEKENQFSRVETDNLSKNEAEKLENTEKPKSQELKYMAWTEYFRFANVVNQPNDNNLFILRAYKDNLEAYKRGDGCNPMIMAALHYRERGMAFKYPSNGQGLFQLYSMVLAGKISFPRSGEATMQQVGDEVALACQVLRGKVGGADLSDLNNINLIGRAFALYNGCSGLHGDQGTPNGWDLCAYTNNKALPGNWAMSQCAVDGCAYMNKSVNYGAMAILAMIMNDWGLDLELASNSERKDPTYQFYEKYKGQRIANIEGNKDLDNQCVTSVRVFAKEALQKDVGVGWDAWAGYEQYPAKGFKPNDFDRLDNNEPYEVGDIVFFARNIQIDTNMYMTREYGHVAFVYQVINKDWIIVGETNWFSRPLQLRLVKVTDTLGVLRSK